MIENAISIEGASQGTITTANHTKLPPGFYDVWGSADMYIKVSKTNAADVTSGTGYLVRSGQTVAVRIVTDAYLGVSGATLTYHKVG